MKSSDLIRFEALSLLSEATVRYIILIPEVTSPFFIETSVKALKELEKCKLKRAKIAQKLLHLEPRLS